MLYPAELGARTDAIQVRGALAVKRNCGASPGVRRFRAPRAFGSRDYLLEGSASSLRARRKLGQGVSASRPPQLVLPP
jgi:hypothetical protein